MNPAYIDHYREMNANDTEYPATRPLSIRAITSAGVLPRVLSPIIADYAPLADLLHMYHEKINLRAVTKQIDTIVMTIAFDMPQDAAMIGFSRNGRILIRLFKKVDVGRFGSLAAFLLRQVARGLRIDEADALVAALRDRLGGAQMILDMDDSADA